MRWLSILSSSSLNFFLNFSLSLFSAYEFSFWLHLVNRLLYLEGFFFIPVFVFFLLLLFFNFFFFLLVVFFFWLFFFFFFFFFCFFFVSFLPALFHNFIFFHMDVIFLWIFIFLFSFLFTAILMAYGISQTRGAAVSGLCCSHSNARSKVHLLLIPLACGNPGSLTHLGKPGI